MCEHVLRSSSTPKTPERNQIVTCTTHVIPIISVLIRFSCAASKDGCYAQRNGMDSYTAVKGSNTWWVGGSRMSGSHAQLKAQCFTSCNTAGGYKYYILHDNTACFCAKQDPTGPKDSSRCGAGGHELWTLPSASLLPSRTPSLPPCPPLPSSPLHSTLLYSTALHCTPGIS